MPNIGDIKGSKELGKRYRGRFQYTACPECNMPHWVALATIKDQRAKGLCRSCVSRHIALANQHRINNPETNRKRSISMTGKNNPSWKGGRFISGGGYIEMYLHPDDFYYPMADKNHRVKGHRLVIAKSLRRCLHSWEIVHHINHIKTDNRMGNLKLTSDTNHKQLTLYENTVSKLKEDNDKLAKRITLLEAEVYRLNTMLERTDELSTLQ